MQKPSNNDENNKIVGIKKADAIKPELIDIDNNQYDGEQFDREERISLKRVGTLSTELEDIKEVEYRKLQLENVILIGVYQQGKQLDAEDSIRELAALAETAGAFVQDALLQQRALPDKSTYLGKGKVAELAEIVTSLKADTVIADTELSPSQRRALEDIVKVKVIDRTAVILDIFSQHAKSKEGKAQVELAQLEYLLPRLRGWGESMSRQAGGQVSGGAGMGSRGPGETKIELDRRRIYSKISKLKKEIKAMKSIREIKRSKRIKNQTPSVAIIGYTNAGKSSVLNRITHAGLLVQNALFATLDPTVRKNTTSDGREYTLSDTVGFIKNLPHQLVDAFQSTFEEAKYADLILHIVDGAHPNPKSQIETVHKVLFEADIKNIPEIIVFNKSDLIEENQKILLRTLANHCVFVSAKTGNGIDNLLLEIENNLPDDLYECEVIIPYNNGELLDILHRKNIVISQEYLENGTKVHAKIMPQHLSMFNDFIIK